MDAKAKLRRMLSNDSFDVAFMPTPLQVSRTYNILNHCLFDGKLKKPTIIIRSMSDSWGLCEGDVWTGNDRWIHDPVCKRITLNDSFPSVRMFIEVLAHEMIHQYQCDFLNRMDHGKTFWAFKPKFNRMGISLFVSRK